MRGHGKPDNPGANISRAARLRGRTLMATPNLRSIWALLFLTYGALLMGGSLYPFRAEDAFGGFDLSFLWAPWPKTITRTDLITNVLIYVPFGLFGARLFFRRRLPFAGWLLVCLMGAAFSASMETLQLFIRDRVASNFDLASNTLGAALGAAVAPWLASHSRTMAWLVAARQHWFRGGWIANAGLILIALWAISQFSLQAPSLLAGGLQSGFKPFWAGQSLRQLDGAVTLIFTLEIASIGLFGALLMRPEKCTPLAVAAFGVAAMLVKIAAAALLVKLAILPRLVSWEVLLGMGGGIVLAIAPVAWRGRPPAAPLVAGVLGALAFAKLLRGLPFITASGLTPDLASQPEVLLNITGIGYVIAEIWPYLALGCAFSFLDLERK